MGFISGFTGGMTLTLGIAYLTVLSHQRTRQAQCDALRASSSVLLSLTTSDPVGAARLASSTTSKASEPSTAVPSFPYLNQSEPRLLPRTRFADELKDRWNSQVIEATHWVQNKDWAEVREDAEAVAGRFWARIVGNGGVDPARENVASVIETVRQDAKSVQDGVSRAVAAAGSKTN